MRTASISFAGSERECACPVEGTRRKLRPAGRAVTSRRPHRTFVLLLAFAAMLALPSVAAADLVLGKHDVPGLEERSATAARIRKALRSALAPARLPRLTAIRVEAARFARPPAELWSAAFVLRSPRTAKQALRAATLSARRHQLVRIRIGVGEVGWLLRRRKGNPRPAVVLWRRDAAVSVIVLRGRRGPGSLRDLAVRYARIVDAREARLLSETAIERTLDRRRPNGVLPRRAALDLFALGYKPLPGTRRPPGRPGQLFDGTIAEREILRVWPTLTKAQHRAALHALGLKRVDLSRRRRSSGARPSSRSPLAGGARADYGDPTFKRNAFLEKLAMKWVSLYQQKLNHRLRFQVVAGTTTEVHPQWFMAAAPIEPDGTLSDNATICRIRQFQLGNSMSPVLREWVMGHEVFHCFQGDIMGPLAEHGAPAWLIEGGATWAAAALDPVPFDLTFGPGARLRDYFETCAVRPLFARSYDGVGFFGHAQDTFGDIWPLMEPILRAPDNLERYALLGGDRPELLDTWASSVLLLRDFGFAWTSRRPIEPPDDARCPPSPLWLTNNGVKAEPFTVAPYLIQAGDAPPNSPLVHVEIDEGSARLGDGKLDTMMLDDEWFCLAQKCECRRGRRERLRRASPWGLRRTWRSRAAARGPRERSPSSRSMPTAKRRRRRLRHRHRVEARRRSAGRLGAAPRTVIRT